MFRKIALMALLSPALAPAQVNQIGTLASAGADATTLYSAYLAPYFNAVGAGLSGGWYNTAKPHKPLGFDLTFSANVAIVPTSDRTFDVSSLNLSQMEPADQNNTVSPTVAGKNSEGVSMVYQQLTQAGFSMPKGTGNPFVPVPMIQLGLGIFKGTELMGRYMPQLGYKDFKSSLWGIGIKHNIDQWIPVIKRVPVFNFSVMGGYTVFQSKVGVDITPESVGAVDISGADWTNQSVNMEVRNFTANLLLSFNFPVVCLYGGAGFSNTRSSLKTVGNYPIPEFDEPNLQMVVDAPTVDPIDIDIKNNDGSVTKPRLNAGLRLKFAVITLHFDYTYAYYNVVSAGLGISVR